METTLVDSSEKSKEWKIMYENVISSVFHNKSKIAEFR